MEKLEKIRYVTANFDHLKGLNMALIGVFTASTGAWTNSRQGDLSLLLVLLVVLVPVKLLVDRYYRRVFGRVSRSLKDRRREAVISVLFGLLGLAAFAADTTEVLPFSAVGILFALAFGWEYFWANRTYAEKYRTHYLAFAAITALISLLPLLGLGALWDTLGFSSPIFGVMTIIGLLMIAAGLLDHIFLVRSLPPQKEFSNGELV